MMNLKYCVYYGTMIGLALGIIINGIILQPPHSNEILPSFGFPFWSGALFLVFTVTLCSVVHVCWPHEEKESDE